MENRDATWTLSPADTKAPQPGDANSLTNPLTAPGELEELIAAARAGERAALNRLLAHVRPRLLSVALRMVRDRDDAEDVVQEALLKVCRHLTRFEGRSAFSTWLHRIVVNTALDRLRRQQARCERAADGERAEEGVAMAASAQAIDEQTPERELGRAETGAAVQEAIACLSPPHQEVLALREIEGESYLSIARIARVPVGTIMSRLHHARRRLAQQLSATFDTAALRAA
jgi:RNA polymerase sigma-70 factor (ECF subfamily)